MRIFARLLWYLMFYEQFTWEQHAHRFSFEKARRRFSPAAHRNSPWLNFDYSRPLRRSDRPRPPRMKLPRKHTAAPAIPEFSEIYVHLRVYASWKSPREHAARARTQPKRASIFAFIFITALTASDSILDRIRTRTSGLYKKKKNCSPKQCTYIM